MSTKKLHPPTVKIPAAGALNPVACGVAVIGDLVAVRTRHGYLLTYDGEQIGALEWDGRYYVDADSRRWSEPACGAYTVLIEWLETQRPSRRNKAQQVA